MTDIGQRKIAPEERQLYAELLVSSFMTSYPKHVHTIGMMSVEIAEMELNLARLLGRLLGVSANIAEAVYFTPKAAIPRVEFLENVAPLVLADNKPKLIAVQKATEKAKGLMGKRHNLIHNRYLRDGGDIISVHYQRGLPQSTPVSLTQLQNLVREIRHLNIRLIDLTDYGSRRNWLKTSP